MPGRATLQDAQEAPQDYTGHELDVATGFHYAGARYYSSALARWGSVDPLSDEFPAWSPYAYSYNNPIRFIDPTGMAPECPRCESRIDNRVERYLSGEITRKQYMEETTLGLKQVVGAIGDFAQNYKEMREANAIGADKYFHCKANCEATQRGEGGETIAILLSDLREFIDLWVKGDPEEASEADQEANQHGRENADTGDCTTTCERFKPDALDSERSNENTFERESEEEQQ